MTFWESKIELVGCQNSITPSPILPIPKKVIANLNHIGSTDEILLLFIKLYVVIISAKRRFALSEGFLAFTALSTAYSQHRLAQATAYAQSII